jgi:short-subunit dehydrogenase/2-polyprenyl-3-methyl-5-hydroxy-6-metoxy-1,4-benzoquinol methylase
MPRLSDFKNAYALVTGASAGLGLALAENFAARGINLVLVARNQEALLSVANSIKGKHAIKVLAVPMDLGDLSAPTMLKGLLEEQDIRIRLLCNSAASILGGDFASHSLDQIQAQIQLNIQTLVSLCHLFFDDLAAEAPSAVINVSSAACFQPVPYISVYAASKAFVQNFSLSLNFEWKSHGIYVQTLVPGPLDTKFNKDVGFVEGRTGKAMSPQEAAEISLRGFEKGDILVKTQRAVFVQRLFALVAPTSTLLKMTGRIVRPLKPTTLRNRPQVSQGIPLNKCRICGTERNPDDLSSHGVIRGNTSRFLRQSFEIWKCPDCHTVHSLNQVDMADIYKDYPINLFQRLDFFAKGRFQNLLKRLRKVGLTKHHKILDMGCGNGMFVGFLKEKGYTVTGYDPYVKEYSYLDKGEKFDFVIANDVIEHVEDPRSFLRDCARLLSADGFLYVGTADSEDVETSRLQKHRMKLHQPFHRLIMTQRTLENLGRELPHFKLIRSYSRSYMDTLKPFVNYRFLDEFNRALGHEMDLAFKSEAGKVLLKKPSLLFWALFGYFLPSAIEPAIILRSDRHAEPFNTIKRLPP